MSGLSEITFGLSIGSRDAGAAQLKDNFNLSDEVIGQFFSAYKAYQARW
jgi:hypothetical protein